MNTNFLIVLGIIFIFGLLVYFAVQYGKKRAEQRRQIVQSLGFTPVENSASLADRINEFYSWDKSSSRTTLSDVFRKTIPDGEIYLFDLEDSDSEKQVLAVLSPDLSLPKFRIFPRIDMDSAAGKLVNKALTWVISKIETPIEFSGVPEFHKQYMVSSSDPDSARRFLDANLLRQFAGMQQCVIQAGGNMFIYSSYQTQTPLTHAALSQRIDQAMSVFRILRSAGEYEGWGTWE